MKENSYSFKFCLDSEAEVCEVDSEPREGLWTIWNVKPTHCLWEVFAWKVRPTGNLITFGERMPEET